MFLKPFYNRTMNCIFHLILRPRVFLERFGSLACRLPGLVLHSWVSWRPLGIFSSSGNSMHCYLGAACGVLTMTPHSGVTRFTPFVHHCLRERIGWPKFILPISCTFCMRCPLLVYFTLYVYSQSGALFFSNSKIEPSLTKI